METIQACARDGEGCWPNETSQEALVLPRGSQSPAMHSKVGLDTAAEHSRTGTRSEQASQQQMAPKVR